MKWELDLDFVIKNLEAGEKALKITEWNYDQRYRKFSQYLGNAKEKSQALRSNKSLMIPELLKAMELRGSAKLKVESKDLGYDKAALDQTQRSINILLKAAEILSQVRDSPNRRVQRFASRLYTRCQSDAAKLGGRKAMENLDFDSAMLKYNECALMIGMNPWLQAALLEVDALKKTSDFDKTYLENTALQNQQMAKEISMIYDQAARTYMRETHYDIRNHNFCKAMSSLFRFISSSLPEDWASWETDKELLPPEMFSSSSNRARVRANILKLAKHTIDILNNQQGVNEQQEEERILNELREILVGTFKEPGLEPKLKVYWNELKKKDERAGYRNGYVHSDSRLKGTLGELFHVFQRFLGVKTPPELWDAYDLYTKSLKHAEMTAEQTTARVSEIKTVLDSGLISTLCELYEKKVGVAVRYYHT